MSCKAATRREFLREGGCSVITLAALGLPAEALALPVGSARATWSGDERTYPVPAADGVTIDRAAQVVLVRFHGKVYAMALACPHEHAAVKWLARDQRFQCTKHDSKYTPEGAYTSGRATRNLDRFPLRRDGASVVVSVDRVFRSDQDAAGWANAAVDAG